MGATVRRVDYFHMMVKDRPGEACRLLSDLAKTEVNLLALNIIPMGLEQTQFVIFPKSVNKLIEASAKLGLTLSGPQHAFLITGDDELGTLIEIHTKLCDASINVASATGVADGRGGFGYVIYVRSDEFDKAANILGV
jgi:hypothetical protein